MKTKLFYFFIFSTLFSLAQQQVPSFGSLQALNITTTSVRFQFNVRTNGSLTNCRVWWSVNSNLAAPVSQSNNISVPQNINWQTRFVDIGGLLPNTTYYWRVSGSNNLGNANSSIVSFTTLNTQSTALPVISNISTNPSIGDCLINYTLNSNNGSTTSVIKYGLDANNLNLTQVGFNAQGTSNVSNPISLSNLNSQSTYFFRIEATNSIGTATSTDGSFTTLIIPPIVANYLFNNSHNNSVGSDPFSSANTSFVADRNGTPNSAIRISSTTTPSTATISNLPVGNAERTISIWFKKPASSTAIGLYAYGANSAGQTFGLYLGANGNWFFQGFGNDHNFGGSSQINTWLHGVLTFKNGVVKLYVNGTLVGSVNYTVNTGTSAFRLGGNQAIVEFDDLQVYNFELTAAQVGDLFNNNQLSVENKSLDKLAFSIYPNPANDFITIDSKIAIKSAEIYSIQGQKVLSTNQKEINISQLNAGIYLVSIEDENGAIATQKLIKK